MGVPWKNFKKIKLKLHPERIPYFFFTVPLKKIKKIILNVNKFHCSSTGRGDGGGWVLQVFNAIAFAALQYMIFHFSGMGS